jgi:hypothetical protein
MKFLRIPLIVLALVGLIALAGCGDDDSTTSDESTTESSTTATDESTTTEASGEALSAEDYSAEITVILGDFGTSFTELGSEITASQDDPEKAAGLFDEAETEIQGAIDDLSALTPPEEAQEGHDQLIAALEDFSSKLTDVSNAADSGDEAGLLQAATDLQAAAGDFQTQFTKALTTLSKAGVDVGAGATG